MSLTDSTPGKVTIDVLIGAHDVEVVQGLEHLGYKQEMTRVGFTFIGSARICGETRCLLVAGTVSSSLQCVKTIFHSS